MANLKLRPEVQWFAEQMEIQLRANDHKGGWQTTDQLDLLHRIRQEATELKQALLPEVFGETGKDVISEAADVANFAMMIADNAKAEGLDTNDANKRLEF